MVWNLRRTMFSRYPYKRLVTNPVRPPGKYAPSIYHRQGLIPGMDQGVIKAASILVIGMGGLGCAYGPAFVRKGFGRIVLLDYDDVDFTNLPRTIFQRKDVGKNKAMQAIRHLAKQATGRTVLEAYGIGFEDSLALELEFRADVVVIGVDDSDTRAQAASYFGRRHIPCVFTAVDRQASYGYVFKQEPGRACFGCKFPDCLEARKVACAPACIDVLQCVSSFVLWAVDSILMDRPCAWNYREIHMAGFVESFEQVVVPKDTCPLCQGKTFGRKAI